MEVVSPPFNVTINGTGFVDTGYLKCVDKSNDLIADGFYVSETEVKCLIPKFMESNNLVLSLSLSESESESITGVTLKVYVNAPAPESAIIEDNLLEIAITFSAAAEANSQADIVNSSLYIDSAKSSCSLGEEDECYFENDRKLIIPFAYDSNCATGDTIAFKKDSVVAFEEKVTKKGSGVETLTIRGPKNLPSLDVEIIGAKSYGTLLVLVADCYK